MTEISRFSSDHVLGPQSESMLYLRLDQIHSCNHQGNGKSEENIIIRLAESIKKYGILHPILVRPASDKHGFPYYELIEGNRRYRAARLAGLDKIPCIILHADDVQCTEATVINRIRAETRHFLEQAKAFRMLMQDYKMTQEEIARKMGLSQSAIANKLRLLKLTEEEQGIILKTGLTERHARCLLRVKNVSARLTLLDAITKQKCTVSETEELIDAYLLSNRAMITQEHKATETSVSAADEQEHAKEDSLSPTVFYFTRETPATQVIASNQTTSQEKSEDGRDVCPRKFAMRDLRPLYNSIDRTLSIFRKTGNAADCQRQENDEEVQIVIRIPKQAQ